MALRPLILPAEVGELARPCYADDALLTQIIAESEREDIRPRIGAAIYVALKEASTEEDLTGGMRVLLLGGTWTDSAGKVRYLDGLKTALAYYVYGRVIRDGNITSTRYGAVIKSDENSNSASDTAERQRQYRQAFAAADTMLTEAVNYIIAAQLGGCEDVPRVTSNRARMSVVGTADGGAQRCKSSTPTIIAGKEGASAYEVAVAQGFRGSEAEWLASLIGPQGEPGPEGPQGPAPDMSDYYTKTEANALLEDKAGTDEVSTIAAGLASEAQKREGADAALRSQVEDVDARVQEGLSAVGDRLDHAEAETAAQKLALDNEATARATSDNALGARINEEADARAAGDEAVLAKVAEEREARKVADDAVASHAQTLVGNEAEARRSGDEQSAQLVANEAISREEADALINGLLDRIKRDLGYNATSSTITLTAGVSGKYVKCETRAAVANSAFAISAPFDVEACSELLIKTGYNPSDGTHAPLDISVISIYEEIERQRTVQKKNASGAPLYYAVNIDPETGSVTVTTDETTEDTGYPVYTTETYTEQRYLPNNEDRWVAIPDSGYYVANIPQSCKAVVSYKPGITDLNVVVVKHGALANLTSQIFGIYEHRTMVEAMVSLAARVDALESRQGLLGNATAGTLDVSELTKRLYPTILRGHGVPAAATTPENLPDGLPWDGVPVFVGQIYINLDATSGGLYYATGHDSVSDWKQA